MATRGVLQEVVPEEAAEEALWEGIPPAKDWLINCGEQIGTSTLATLSLALPVTFGRVTAYYSAAPTLSAAIQ